MRLVVCDTGPLLHLSEVGRLDLLSSAGTIAIPAAVAEELDFHLPAWGLNRPDWIRVDVLSPDAADQAIAWQTSGMLHAGEAESLALARQARCDWYLTDDAAARIFASSLGLEVHGTIGVVLWAAATGVLDKPETEFLLDRLANDSSLWVSPRILSEAKSALEQLCSR
jgi:predicted nucleic acid-binding protein